MDFSVVVISRNRSRYLERLFGYFAAEGLKAPLLLGDASNSGEAASVSGVCDRFGNRLDIRYTPYPEDHSPVGRLRSEYDKVHTDTVIWVGDDDLVSPRVLRNAADHLGRSPDCVAVTGRAVTFSVVGDGPGGIVSGMGNYQQKGYLQAKASDRLLALAKDGVALTYSLRRTSVVRHMLGEIEGLALPDDALGYYFLELLDGMLTVLAGQVHLSDDVMMARQVHARSTAAVGRKRADSLNLLVRPDWPAAFGKVQRLLANRLAEVQPGMGIAAREEFAATMLWMRVRAMLDKELARRLGMRSGLHLRSRAMAALLRLQYGIIPGFRRRGDLGRMIESIEMFPAAG